MKIKQGWRFLAFGVAAFFLSQGSAAADSRLTQNVEVLLGQVFIPETGYGTNNNVQVTLDGYLPNSCYQLAQARLDWSQDGHTLVIHQFADLQKEGICAQGQELPPHLSGTIPYTYDLSLGRLPAGNYKILFNEMSGRPRIREFHVYASNNLTADDFPYAAVSTISMPDIVNGLRPVVFKLSGTFTSSCNYLNDVKVTHENDVIVVQPILGYRDDGKSVCAQAMIPFEQSVGLGRMSEGRYLVHVRSMSGKSISHAFNAVMPDPR